MTAAEREGTVGTLPDAASVAWGEGGLVAAVVQDASDGRVLMVGWQDAEALEATRRTGEVHFHSRSRATLWRKGETSGNVLRLVSAALDCDADALLLQVRPAGPTCHTGARSCFEAPTDDAAPADGPTHDEARPAPGAHDEARPAAGADDQAGRAAGADDQAGRAAGVDDQAFAWLEILWSTISERAATRPPGSYTSALLAGGVDAVARKVAEEATEVVLAAKDHAAQPGAETDAALAGELADLVFHALVLCAERGIDPARIIETLRARHA